MSKINQGLFTSNDQTWETPQDLFDKLDSVFNFELDVCAVPSTSKCNKYFTPEIDGLKQNWKGNCWMNPPYGREQIKWVNKAWEETKKHGSNVMCLIPARPDTKVWHETIFANASAICFIKGRLKFGNSQGSAPFPSALIYFGNELNREQEKCLREIGKLFKVECEIA